MSEQYTDDEQERVVILELDFEQTRKVTWTEVWEISESEFKACEQEAINLYGQGSHDFVRLVLLENGYEPREDIVNTIDPLEMPALNNWNMDIQ